MFYSKLACVAAFAATGAYAQGNGLTLDSSVINKGSQLDGSTAIGAVVTQAKSLTSNNNFINGCAGKTITNGLQITTGSCNPIPMGDIPAKNKMVSSVITFPTTGGADIQSDTTFDVTIQVANLQAGSFTNPQSTYYAAPQFLNGGVIVGHTHVTIQDLGGSLNPTQPLDATQFAFFKGIDDAGNGKGTLTATVTGGLPAGNYRACTMASASNHQAVLMPVAQRGFADDCTKFKVGGNGKVINDAANNGVKGIAAASKAAQAIVDSTNSASAAADAVNLNSVSSAAAASSTTPAAAGGKNAGGKGGKAASTSSAAASSSPAAGNGGKNGGGGKKAVSNTAAAASSSSTTSAAATSSTVAAGKGGAGKGGAGKGGNGGRFGGGNGKPGGRKQRFARRQFIA